MSLDAFRRSVDAVVGELDTHPEDGLSPAEVRKRRRQYGANQLRKARKRSALEIFAGQFTSPIIWLLAAAAVVSFLLGEVLQGAAILVALAVNAAIGFVTELKAVRSIEALRELGGRTAKVRRGGQVKEVPAEQLVPGDLVLLEAGDIVSADLRLIESNALQCDESALTGESAPVPKTAEALEGEVPLAERRNTAFKGTATTRGSAAGIVVAIGMDTELGKIAAMAEAAESETTPLEKRLEGLARTLIWLTLVVAAAVGVSGFLAGKDLVLMIETAVALAVAAVPEGLPIVATVALARGMWRMARRNAVIEKLAAVETLGSTSIIFTDKTGTLTENRMQVQRLLLGAGEPISLAWQGERRAQFSRDQDGVEPQADPALARALQIAALCTNASLGGQGREPVGDPMEIGLMRAAAAAGMAAEDLREEWPEVREESFDPDTRMMATIHRAGEDEDGSERFRFAVKGAPEAVLAVCDRVLVSAEGETVPLDEDGRADWMQSNDALAREGLRLLALADKTLDDAGAPPYQGLTLVGLVGLHDPPRGDVRDSILACRNAGIRVHMVTGDQPQTALSIAEAIGLTDEEADRVVAGRELEPAEGMSPERKEELRVVPVFARVSPAQKLDLVGLHQEVRDVVAMTGDGVNDAPALKKADVGIAMGQRGTQVAREAADMVLKDDAFPTIVAAIAQGRAIFDNIRRFIVYLLSGNLGEILAVGIAGAMAVPLPLLPLQILFINAILDVFPALALGVGKGDERVMDRPPRDPEEALLTPSHWLGVVCWGALLAATLLGVFFLALFPFGMTDEKAVTISFLTLGFARLWHVFNMRSTLSDLWRNDVTDNPFVWGALVLCAALLLAAVYLPGVSEALEVVEPGWDGWALILGGSLVPLIVGQGVKIAGGRLRRYRMQ